MTTMALSLSSPPEAPPSLLTDTRLRPYLDDLRLWHGYVRFLGLPNLLDSPDTPLSQLFVPPALSAQPVSPAAPPAGWPAGQSVLGLLAQRRRLVVLGDPGSGKTTLINWIVWLLAGGAQMNLPSDLTGLLPLPMVLRELKLEGVNGFDDLLTVFLDRPVAAALKPQREVVMQQLRDGRALLLIDGLDEVFNPGDDRRPGLRQALVEAAERYPKAFFTVTSRIVGYDECALPESRPQAGVGDFADVADTAVAPDWHRAYVMPFDNARIASFATQWHAVRSIRQRADQDAGQLLKAVHASPTMEELARLPQLLTLMALVFRVNARLPDGRAMLYAQMVEAYLLSIDAARQSQTERPVVDTVDWREKQRWLSHIGFEMQQLRAGSAGASTVDRALLVPRSDVLQWLNKAMGPIDDPTPQAYLDWVARRSGLLLPRSEGLYAFVHLSFQEYFAALYLETRLVDADWIMAQRGGPAFDDGDNTEVTAGNLREWAGERPWQEVLVFAAERLAGRPRDVKRLSDWLFGADLAALKAVLHSATAPSAPAAAVAAAAPGAELLARLASNTHSGWSTADRQAAVTLLLPYVGHGEQVLADASQRASDRPVTRLLLGREASARQLQQWLNLQQPQQLALQGAGPVKLAYLRGLAGLRRLVLGELADNDLADLAELGPVFGGLEDFAFDAAPSLTRLRGIEGLTCLQHLAIANAPCSDLTPLRQLTALQSLTLMACPVRDLSALADLPNLERLIIGHAPVTDLAPLAACQSLRFLAVNTLRGVSLAPLAALPNLSNLFIHADMVVPDTLRKRQGAERLRIHLAR